MARKKLITKILKNDGHTMQCDICYDMTRRGYNDEDEYWEDLFRGKLKTIKFKLILQVDKKTFDKWMICTRGGDNK